jgi:hypothetical protein
MADKLFPTVAAVPEFVAGETPQADKITVIGAQLRWAAEQLEKAVGDLHGVSYPYSPVNSAYLSMPRGVSPTLGTLFGSGDGRSLDIANLARLVGPASNLNPYEVPGSTSVTESIAAGVHEIALRFKPISTTNPVFSDSTGAFVHQVLTTDALVAAGDYMVTAEGKVFTFTATVSSTVTYDYNSLWAAGGRNASHQTFNVIPDPSQLDGGGAGCTVSPAVLGKYTVTTPAATHQQTDVSLVGSALTAADPNYNVQIPLPYQLTNNYFTGDEIPQGFIYLKNASTNKTYEHGTYYYVDQYSVEVESVDLDDGIAAGNTWQLVTVGSDITSSIDDLRIKSGHSHNRLLGDSFVDYLGISGHLAALPPSGWYGPSNVDGNFAPQYLHRDGYQAGDLGAADRGVMRGDLVMGDSTASPGSYATGLGDSFRLYFGPTARGCYLYRTAANLLHVNGDGMLLSADNTITQVAGLDWTVTAAINASIVALGNVVIDATAGSMTQTAGTSWSATSSAGSAVVESTGGNAVLRSTDSFTVIDGPNDGVSTDDVLIRLPNYLQGSQLKIFEGTGTTRAPIVTDSLVAIRGETGHATNDLACVLSVENHTSTAVDTESIIDLRFVDATTPANPVVDKDKHFLRFLEGTGAGRVCGGVRGTEVTGPGNISTTAAFAVFPDTNPFAYGQGGATLLPLPTVPPYIGLRVDGIAATSEAVPIPFDTADEGNVQFYSGAADFGEWLECGDLRDFYSPETDEDYDRLVAACKKAGNAGLTEGRVVWVRDQKFYASGPGTPMVVTKRAALCGNSHQQERSEGRGQAISFCGQVPVLVDGPCKDGDLLVPVQDQGYCIAVDPDEISFDNYRKAIGTAWGTDPADGPKKITCAVGIK